MFPEFGGELQPLDWEAGQKLWLNNSSSKLHVYKNHHGVLLKGRFLILSLSGWAPNSAVLT